MGNGSEGDDGGDDNSWGNNGGVSDGICGYDGAAVADLALLLLFLLPSIGCDENRRCIFLKSHSAHSALWICL